MTARDRYPILARRTLEGSLIAEADAALDEIDELCDLTARQLDIIRELTLRVEPHSPRPELLLAPKGTP